MIGLVEYPPWIAANIEEPFFPVVTMDVMASVMDILNVTGPVGETRALDGISLRTYFAERCAAVLIGEPQPRALLLAPCVCVLVFHR